MLPSCIEHRQVLARPKLNLIATTRSVMHRSYRFMHATAKFKDMHMQHQNFEQFQALLSGPGAETGAAQAPGTGRLSHPLASRARVCH